MFYATAGQQATQQPPASRGAMGAFGRSGPPGFGGRGADPNDFPALGSHPQHGSTYAAQAQPSQPSTASNQQQQQQNTHLQQQQQLFLQQQQLGVAPPPPPPPGISGPAGAGSGQANGALGDDFPANPSNPSQLGQPSSPSNNGLPNGSVGTGPGAPSASQSSNATPSTNPPHPQAATNDSTWQRTSPSRPTEPVVRPVQQILSSPVDKWGLKALLYEIQVHMNKTDRGMLIFGEDLGELGVDVNSEEYARGWRYHTELHIWLTSPTLPSIDLSKADVASGQPNWIRGPFMYLDTRTWTKQRTAEDFTIDGNVLEVTRRAEDIVREENVRKEVGNKSPNGAVGLPVQGQQQPYQR
ncbi:hypothetical protein CI109_102310 [Kwoniella shandongensis]|uniref:NOT2/NOT3/NOT5 C-terminal domain-containing protein n=1 Tax=Kwoniella shandongensis TaxID=1734106 RepID=A0AAJ8LG46_9TREE